MSHSIPHEDWLDEKSDAQESCVSHQEVFRELLIDMRKVKEIPTTPDIDELRLIRQAMHDVLHPEDLAAEPDPEVAEAQREIRALVERISRQQFVAPSEQAELAAVVRGYRPDAEIPPHASVEYLLGVMRGVLAPPVADDQERGDQLCCAVQRVLERSGIKALGITTLQRIARHLADAGTVLESEANSIAILPKDSRLLALVTDIVMHLTGAEFSPAAVLRSRKKKWEKQRVLHESWPSIDHYEDDLSAVAELFVNEYQRRRREIEESAS